MTDSCSILPGCKGVAEFTLALKRDKKSGLWLATLVCSRCRKSLEREARTQGKTIKFFGLEGSKREAEKRNTESQSLCVFLSEFAEPAVKAELKKVQSTLRVVASR